MLDKKNIQNKFFGKGTSTRNIGAQRYQKRIQKMLPEHSRMRDLLKEIVGLCTAVEFDFKLDLFDLDDLLGQSETVLGAIDQREEEEIQDKINWRM